MRDKTSVGGFNGRYLHTASVAADRQRASEKVYSKWRGGGDVDSGSGVNLIIVSGSQPICRPNIRLIVPPNPQGAPESKPPNSYDNLIKYWPISKLLKHSKVTCNKIVSNILY